MPFVSKEKSDAIQQQTCRYAKKSSQNAHLTCARHGFLRRVLSANATKDGVFIRPLVTTHGQDAKEKKAGKRNILFSGEGQDEKTQAAHLQEIDIGLSGHGRRREQRLKVVSPLSDVSEGSDGVPEVIIIRTVEWGVGWDEQHTDRQD